MKNLTFKNILLIICTYIFISIILPIFFKYLIFENSSISNLNNSEWASFLGSYVGGILGGLGTLIAVYITVKETRNMQIDNKNDTDKKLLEDKQSREIERKENKLESEKKEKLRFTDGIAEYVGKYITYISNYYYASRRAETLNNRLIDITNHLTKCEHEITSIGQKIEITNDMSDEFMSLNIKKDNLNDKKKSLERKLLQINSEIDNNRKFGERTIANECFFIINTKLKNISEATELLSLLESIHNGVYEHLDTKSFTDDWLGNNSEHLMTIFSKFKNTYCN
ncbi:MAG: hypothetical protein Q4F66_02520 [Clostridium sp.]|nr:hypothetical protein [Clostridium sp.]